MPRSTPTSPPPKPELIGGLPVCATCGKTLLRNCDGRGWAEVIQLLPYHEFKVPCPND